MFDQSGDLVGRDAERALIDRCLDGARKGSGAALVLRGTAGVGKTALCDYARSLGHDLRCLQASGVASESGLAFGVLHATVRPLLGYLEKIPSQQREALSGAIGLGAPVGGDPFAVYAGTLNLLATASEDHPLLVVVDDLQWVDDSSRAALLFTARRLEAESVVILLAERGEPTLEDPDLRALDVIPLAGLDLDATTELLAHETGIHPGGRAARQLWDVTRGNPLAVVEFAAHLDESQLRGTEPLPRWLPLSARMRSFFHRELDGLPPAVRQAMVVAAASSGDAGTVRDAIVAWGLARDVLDGAETEGLLRITDGRVVFRHPLLRTAVYDGAAAAERRQAHRALASVLTHDPDRRILHLAVGADGPDEALAGELETSAGRSAARAGLPEAASRFQRAAELSTDPRQRRRRHLLAAEAYDAAGYGERAAALLSELDEDEHPATRARVLQVKGLVDLAQGRLNDAHVRLATAGKELEDEAPADGARLRLASVVPLGMKGDLIRGIAVARHVHDRVAGSGTAQEAAAAGMLGPLLLLAGRRREAMPLIGEAERALREGDLLDASIQPLLFFVGQALVFAGLHERAAELLHEAIRQAHGASALRRLPFPLALLARAQFRTGSWASARANATEAVTLSEETGNVPEIAHALTVLARIEAGRDLAGALEHGRRARELARRHGIDSLGAFVDAALGHAELAQGNIDAAIGHLEPAVSFNEDKGLREAATVQCLPDLVEAQVRAGMEHDASRTLAMLEDQAQMTGTGWTVAVAARCRGLLASGDDAFSEFDAALSHHAEVGMPFETARTRLALGERLRRARRKRDARRPLVAALEAFERLGARPWAQRARDELAAAGGPRPPREEHPADALTPRELQVAVTVARGATNREAGAALFLSPKTIENHLTSIYGKVGVRSRTELTRLVHEQELPT